MTNKKTTWLEVAERLNSIQQERKDLARQESILKKTLIELSGNKSHVEGEYMLKMSIKKGSINYAAIPALAQIDLEEYRRPDITSWSLMTTKMEN